LPLALRLDRVPRLTFLRHGTTDNPAGAQRRADALCIVARRVI